jgi:L-ribulose-5-phosphate 4-epimerase
MLDALKEQVCQANLDLVTHGLVVLTWGNASAIDRENGLVVIKPSGVAYSQMTPGDMVVVDLEGKVVEGNLRPSSDTPTHVELYKAWPDVGGIVHTHAVVSTAFAQAQRPIPCLGTTHADGFYGEVPVTRPLSEQEVAGDYEANTGTVIVECLSGRQPLHMPAVLVAQHGPFTWGATVDDAVKSAVVLEKTAEMALATLQLAPQGQAIPAYLLEKHFLRKHGENAYYGQGK